MNPHDQLTAAAGEIAEQIIEPNYKRPKTILEIAELISTNPTLVSMAEQHQRMFDLVRYQRAELHQSDLITDEEYAMLCQEGATGEMKGSVQRLETYDQLQTKCAELQERVMELEKQNQFVIAELNSIGNARYLGTNFRHHFHQLFGRCELLKQALNPTTKP